MRTSMEEDDFVSSLDELTHDRRAEILRTAQH
jgi:hypothetical protein